jgi:hypothetical protein
MTFAVDVYVWVPAPKPEVLTRFIDGYVAGDTSAEQRLSAFQRIYVLGTGTEEDVRCLAENNRPPGSGAFTLYLQGRAHAFAMITMTVEGAAVLGLSIEEDLSPEPVEEAKLLLRRLRDEFSAPAGLAGWELPPPHSRAEWLAEEELVVIREGTPPPDLDPPDLGS